MERESAIYARYKMTTGLFIQGGNSDQWNGLALGDLNMNNFSITNVNTITILQTATTGQALDVSRNLAAASTDSSIVCFYNLNAGDDQPVLTVRTASNAAAANPMVIFDSTDVAYGQNILHIIQDGTGGGILLDMTLVTGGIGFDMDQDANNYGIRIQSAATTNTFYALQVVTGAGATVANFEYSGNEFARIGMHNDANGSFWFYRNLVAADTAGAVVFIENDHANDDTHALDIQQDAPNHALYIDMNGTVGQAVSVDHNSASGIAAGIRINRNTTDAADNWGLEIDCNNAGAGVPGGIDLSSFTAGEALLKVPVDALTVGTHYGRYAVNVIGVGIKYVDIFDAPA